MKKGDRVVCIDNFGASTLKIGNSYIIFDIYKDMICLDLSSFEENGFRIDRFEEISKYIRRQKLQKINSKL